MAPKKKRNEMKHSNIICLRLSDIELELVNHAASQASKIKKYRQWQCLHCSSRPLTVLRILLSLSVAFFNFKRCLKQLIVLKYMLIQIRV